LFNLLPDFIRELSLFNPYQEKHERLMETMDKINNKYGEDIMRIAIQEAPLRHRLHQQNLSPCYTTRWKDILIVKA